MKLLRFIDIDMINEEKRSSVYDSKPNEFQQALCILGKSGVGKSTTTEDILRKMGYEYDLIIPTATTTSLLSQFSPSKGDIRPSRLGKLIMKAFDNPDKNFVAIIDECHKSSTIEMINDELLQSISKSRNIDRTISLDDDSAKLFTGLNKDKYGNLIIPNNFGFIFLSSKPDIITSNSDFFNRVDVKVLTKNPQDGKKPESFNDSEYFTDIAGDSLYRKSKSDVDKIKELIPDNEN
jgi:hypothetical protein